MSDYVVIADVGDSLRKLLWDSMRHDSRIYPAIIESEEEITLASPQEDGESGKLSVFLYQISENAFLKNKELEAAGSSVLRFPPIVLDLYYLVTATAEDRKKDHILLGKAIQVFHDNGIFRGSLLSGSLQGVSDGLRIVPHPIPFDQLLQLWQSFTEKSFTLSLSYQVTPIRVDSTRENAITRIVTQ